MDRLRRVLAALSAALFLALSGGAALAEARIALVVGNSAYGSVPQLDNPVPDAELMARALEDAGFEVTLLADAGQVALVRAIAQFGRDLRATGEESTGLFYYAGHGVQSFGSNFLLPVDVNLTDAADLPLVAVEAQAVLRQMASARNRTNIVILDACRDNPFETVPDMNDNGLAEMKAPTGTFLAYATAPGSVALDGTGGNSPFTSALARRISEPGLPIEQLFKDVRVEVLDETGGSQVPWDTSSLTRDFAFVTAPAVAPDTVAGDLVWSSIRDSRDPVQVVLFLSSHPDSPHRGEARALLAELMATDTDTTLTATGTTEDREHALFETARASATPDAYRAYLDAFPDGAFAELATQELAALDPAAAASAAPLDPVLFDRPIPGEMEGVSGRTISELIAGAPRFPPIEGLPDAVWKNQACSSCHDWTRDRLCTQANTYTADAGSRSLAKQHPYGGGFKRSLRRWAEGGCQ